MKRRFWVAIVLLVTIFMLPISAEATVIDGGTCGPDLTWVLDDTGTLTISGTGEMYDYEWGKTPWIDCSVSSVIIEEGVMSIGVYAFNCCWDIGNVTLAESVESIGFMAFANIRNLKKIAIPQNVASIGLGAFMNCSGLKEIWVSPQNVHYSVDDYGVLFNKAQTQLIYAHSGVSGHYAVPDTVEEIGRVSFCDSDNLMSISFPGSVTAIGDEAFRRSHISFLDITFEGNAPAFGQNAFGKIYGTVYYRSDNPTWTDDVKQNYGGHLTWVPYTPTLDNVTITKIIPHVTGNIIYWDAVEDADIYQIYRLNGSKWELLKNTRSLGYKDETAKVGVKHYYKIVARNGDVKSDIKTTASASAIRPASTLANVTVYKTIGHSSGNILYWNAVDGAKLYQVYRLNGTTWELLKNTGSLGYKDETAPKGVACYYKIVARNGDVKSDIRTTTSTRVIRAK